MCSYLDMKGCLVTEISQARWVAFTGEFRTSIAVDLSLSVTVHSKVDPCASNKVNGGIPYSRACG